MTTLVDICRETAAGIPGSKIMPSGGLNFRRHGFEGRVLFDGGVTDILLDTRDLVGTMLQVSTAGLWHDVRGIFGRHDLQVGDREFDAGFEIIAGSEGYARERLTPEVRSILRHLNFCGGCVWRISRGGFLLRVRRWPESSREFDGWLVAAFQLLESIPGATAAEKVRLSNVKVEIDADSSCQICGTSLSKGPSVRCAKCATPHHKDCWEFNGRCSIFACGETRWR